MPTKRYGLVFGLIALYLIKSWVEVMLMIILRPDMFGTLLVDRYTANPLEMTVSILIGISALFYIARRVYFVLFKKELIIIGGVNNQLHAVQKIGFVLLNIFYIIFALSIVALIGTLFLAKSGGSSGVAAGMVFMVSMLFCILSVLLVEIGNYINKKKINKSNETLKEGT